MTRTTVLAGLALLVAVAALGSAYGSQAMGLVPCALCLLERWPYWALGAVAILALLVRRRAVLWLAVACMAAGVALGTTHAGVEQGWWPDPLPECAAPSFSGGSIADRLRAMPSRPAKPCDSPTYLVPGLPLSMAAMDAILALAFGAFLATSLVRPTRRHA